MGSQTIPAAVQACNDAGVSQRARLIAFYMAWQCLDHDTPKTPARIYFGGWDALAHILGLPMGSSVGERAVARGIKELTDAGLIKAEYTTRGGRRRQHYRVLP